MKTSRIGLIILAAVIFTFQPVFAEKETRNVSDFSRISLRLKANVYLQQGDKQHVALEANAKTLDDIITEVRNGKLIIRFPNRSGFWKKDPGKISIYITTPSIEGVNVSGSGNIVADKQIKSSKIKLSVSGSGDIRMHNLISNQVDCAISGSGDIKLAGKENSSRLNISISGSGDVSATDFRADDVNIAVAGSGDCSVFAEENLTVKIAGSGDVYYRGNPQITSSIVGSGDIKKK